MFLFVYGSLKRGYWNNRHLAVCGATFVCNGTISGVLLNDVVGEHTYPGAVIDPARVRKLTKGIAMKTIVSGEIWDVPETAFERLDRLEYGYDRRVVPAATEDGKQVDVRVYEIRPDRIWKHAKLSLNGRYSALPTHPEQLQEEAVL